MSLLYLLKIITMMEKSYEARGEKDRVMFWMNYVFMKQNERKTSMYE